MNKFFLYARKSTDEPDRQILSIEAQIDELKEFATREQLEVVETLVETYFQQYALAHRKRQSVRNFSLASR